MGSMSFRLIENVDSSSSGYLLWSALWVVLSYLHVTGKSSFHEHTVFMHLHRWMYVAYDGRAGFSCSPAET